MLRFTFIVAVQGTRELTTGLARGGRGMGWADRTWCSKRFNPGQKQSEYSFDQSMTKINQLHLVQSLNLVGVNQKRVKMFFAMK